MADWVDTFHEILEFERSLFGGRGSFRKPQILMSQQQWEDIKAYNAMDATVAAAVSIAADDRKVGWPTGSKPIGTSLPLEKSQQCLYGQSFVRSLGSVRSLLQSLKDRLSQALLRPK
jgi:hypothetical protein